METLSKSYPLATAAPAHHELLLVVHAVIGSCDSSRGLPAARFAEEELRRIKIDAIDALGIARFPQRRPRAAHLPDAVTEELRDPRAVAREIGR